VFLELSARIRREEGVGGMSNMFGGSEKERPLNLNLEAYVE